MKKHQHFLFSKISVKNTGAPIRIILVLVIIGAGAGNKYARVQSTTALPRFQKKNPDYFGLYSDHLPKKN